MYKMFMEFENPTEYFTGKKETIQGFAVYGSMGFILYHTGVCGVYDLASQKKAPIAVCKLGSYNPGDLDIRYANHANDAMFGPKLPGEAFPLLYVTAGNSGEADEKGLSPAVQWNSSAGKEITFLPNWFSESTIAMTALNKPLIKPPVGACLHHWWMWRAGGIISSPPGTVLKRNLRNRTMYILSRNSLCLTRQPEMLPCTPGILRINLNYPTTRCSPRAEPFVTECYGIASAAETKHSPMHCAKWISKPGRQFSGKIFPKPSLPEKK